MRLACDFDGTIVKQDGRAYDDVTTPLEFIRDPGTGYTSKDALLALKAAGHVLILWSARASRALLYDESLDPFVRCGARRADPVRWERNRGINQARMAQMLDFIDAELPGVFACIDDGAAGKPSVDAFIDDRALRLGNGPGALTWAEIAFLYGERPAVPQPTTTKEIA
jgi:hypothetical protein